MIIHPVAIFCFFLLHCAHIVLHWLCRVRGRPPCVHHGPPVKRKDLSLTLPLDGAPLVRLKVSKTLKSSLTGEGVRFLRRPIQSI